MPNDDQLAKLNELAALVGDRKSSVREFTQVLPPVAQPPLLQPQRSQEDLATASEMRQACERAAAKLGVTLAPDSLVIPIPVSLMEAIINRLLRVEALCPSGRKGPRPGDELLGPESSAVVATHEPAIAFDDINVTFSPPHFPEANP